MKLLSAFCFLLLGFFAGSQNLLKGVVLDAEKSSPLPNARNFPVERPPAHNPNSFDDNEGSRSFLS